MPPTWCWPPGTGPQRGTTPTRAAGRRCWCSPTRRAWPGCTRSGLTAIGDAELTVHVVGPAALAGNDLPFPLLQGWWEAATRDLQAAMEVARDLAYL